MIYKLRKKFIRICFVSFASVFFVLLLSILIMTYIQTNSTLDSLADIISENNGRFPEMNEPRPEGKRPFPPREMDRETPFTTRYFTVSFDRNGSLLSADIRFVASVDGEQAAEYAERAMKKGRERGWLGDFRYKLISDSDGTSVLFVNGSLQRDGNRRFVISTLLAFTACSVMILVLVTVISKRAVKPVAESYEKQKRFVTDASHELKTPLTLIRANVDILSAELGENEWLCDIRDETDTLSELVTKLVSLARMDEEENEPSFESFNISEAVRETVDAFEPRIISEDKVISVDIEPDIKVTCNEAGMRQVLAILLDNAAKYCDEKGVISVSLKCAKKPILSVENTYKAIDGIAIDRLFDRFYRADGARTHGSGFGIGLSIAKAVCEKNKCEIKAYKSKEAIGFKIKYTA